MGPPPNKPPVVSDGQGSAAPFATTSSPLGEAPIADRPVLMMPTLLRQIERRMLLKVFAKRFTSHLILKGGFMLMSNGGILDCVKTDNRCFTTWDLLRKRTLVST
jgi:hypothetical protein